jgi:hypothetical protein
MVRRRTYRISAEERRFLPRGTGLPACGIWRLSSRPMPAMPLVHRSRPPPEPADKPPPVRRPAAGHRRHLNRIKPRKKMSKAVFESAISNSEPAIRAHPDGSGQQIMKEAPPGKNPPSFRGAASGRGPGRPSSIRGRCALCAPCVPFFYAPRRLFCRTNSTRLFCASSVIPAFLFKAMWNNPPA